jgi:HNH endonuclease.
MEELTPLLSFAWRGTNGSPGVRPHALPIEGFEDYLIRGDGIVFTMKYGNTREKKHVKGAHGYRIVALYRNGKATMKYVHRLVAEAFIPNPDNKPQVNHLNGDITDNRAENLEWVTGSENQLHSYKLLGRMPSGGVPKRRVVCVETGVIYDSIAEAGVLSGLGRINISHAINGRQETSGGLTWRHYNG